jgi:hypothetical protein
MSGVDLRPLSLGEILDRTFSLYRSNFLLFFSISAIPQLAILAVGLVSGTVAPSSLTLPSARPNQPVFPSFDFSAGGLLLLASTAIVGLVAYLFSQGGTILAVSDLYLGRPTTIAASFGQVWDEIGPLFGVIVLSGLAVLGGLLLLIIPGIYVGCRLLVSVPVALIEKRGPRESLSRSFDLTRGSAGRAFVIVLLRYVLMIAVGLLLGAPVGLVTAFYSGDPAMLRLFNALTQVSSSIAAVLVNPILLIAISVFYYDLRVRKEAFDLQFMMDPNSQRTPGAGDVPSILS